MPEIRKTGIPKGWELQSLEEVAEVVMGQSPPGNSYNQGGKGVPLINGPVEFGDRYPSKLQWTTLPTKFCEPNDILFCVRGSTTGRMNISNDVFCIGRGIAAIRGRKDIAVTGFIELCLRQLAEAILSEARGSGSTFPSITSERLAKTTVLLPPLHEQKGIVEVLDTIDSTIAHTSTLIAKLKQMKAGLLHDLLTRGLDENGKLRDAIEHPEQFKDSPLGQIPKDWRVSAIGTVCSLVKDGTHTSPKRVDNGPLLLGGQNIVNGHIRLTDSDTRVSWDFYRSMHKTWEILVGDVLLSIIGTLGKTAIVTPMEPFTLLRNVAVLRGKPELVSNSFLNLYLSSEQFQNLFKNRSNQTAQPAIFLSELAALSIVLPSLREQTMIDETVRVYDARIHAEETYFNKLKEQKKGLMHDLLTGRVRVTDLQKISA